MSISLERSKGSEKLKNYRISVSGYGGESAYISISKAACDFWIESLENSDNDAVEYCLNADSSDFDFDEISEVPADAKFLFDEKSGQSDHVFESPDKTAHLWGPSVQLATVDVDLIENVENPDEVTENVISGEGVDDLSARIGDQTDFEVDIFEEPADGTISYPSPGDCVFLFTSLEKGTFYECFVSLSEEFDATKIRFVVGEAPDGQDIVLGVKYDGQAIENLGGDTVGQGYSAHAWEQL